MTDEAIVNKVANSSLVSIDMDEYLSEIKVVFFDLKPFLFQEIVLREKDFRAAIKEHDWSKYQDTAVVVGCSADAIIPTWAYMLVTSQLIDVASNVVFGSESDLEKSKIDLLAKRLGESDFADKKVVIKGCGDLQMRDYAYVEITKALKPRVSSLMYGEPCSTVPVYKKPRSRK